MSGKLKPTHTQPGGLVEKHPKADNGVVNDSLGTVDSADSSGIDEDKETGDGKRENRNTRED